MVDCTNKYHNRKFNELLSPNSVFTIRLGGKFASVYLLHNPICHDYVMPDFHFLVPYNCYVEMNTNIMNSVRFYLLICHG